MRANCKMVTRSGGAGRAKERRRKLEGKTVREKTGDDHAGKRSSIQWPQGVCLSFLFFLVFFRKQKKIINKNILSLSSSTTYVPSRGTVDSVLSRGKVPDSMRSGIGQGFEMCSWVFTEYMLRYIKVDLD